MPSYDEFAKARARADIAEQEAANLRQRLAGSESDISAGRQAVRAGDWDALWAALGIPATQRLPEMHTALDTAVELGGLTVEQEIRVEALHAAATISAPAGYDSGEVLDIAARFESYVRDGAA